MVKIYAKHLLIALYMKLTYTHTYGKCGSNRIKLTNESLFMFLDQLNIQLNRIKLPIENKR